MQSGLIKNKLLETGLKYIIKEELEANGYIIDDEYIEVILNEVMTDSIVWDRVQEIIFNMVEI